MVFGVVKFGRLVAFAPPSEAGWHFENDGVIASSGNAYDIAVADMDGDGDLDAVVANGGGVVLINDGTGEFTAATFSFADAISVALGDFDGDGDADAVFSSIHNRGTIWLNNGAGSLSLGAQLTEEEGGYSVEVGDFDGDGDADILSVCDGEQLTRVYSNDGTGNFSETWSQSTFFARHAVVADFDGDNDLDFITSQSSSSRLIYVNDGTGSFTSRIGFAGNGNMTSLFYAGASGDVDGDGDIDIVMRVRDGSGDRIFLNDGSGSFTDSGQRLAQGPGHIELADFDTDGDLDLISAAWANFPTVVYENRGDGVFAEVQRFAGATFGEGVSSGDFDGDGDIDVLIGSLAQGESHVSPVILLRNEPGSLSTLDLTRPIPAFSARGMSLVLPTSLFAALPEATIFTADINGQPLPEWLTFDPATRTLAFEAGAADPGTLLLQVTVTASTPDGQSLDVFVPLAVLDGVAVPGASGAGDTLSGRQHGDFLDGQGGDDTLSGRNGSDLIEGRGGDDLIYGGNGDDVLLGGDGNDTIRGGNGFNLMAGEAGDDIMYGGAFTDQLVGGAGNDVLMGGRGDDFLLGGDGADILRGALGNDLLDGGGGNDILNGGDGDDQLSGGAGNDVFRGGFGNDLCFGDAGADLFIFGPGCGDDVVADFQTGEDRLKLAEGVTLDSAADHDFNFDLVADSTLLSLSDGGSILLYGIVGLSDPDILFA